MAGLKLRSVSIPSEYAPENFKPKFSEYVSALDLSQLPAAVRANIYKLAAAADKQGGAYILFDEFVLRSKATPKQARDFLDLLDSHLRKFSLRIEPRSDHQWKDGKIVVTRSFRLATLNRVSLRSLISKISQGPLIEKVQRHVSATFRHAFQFEQGISSETADPDNTALSDDLFDKNWDQPQARNYSHMRTDGFSEDLYAVLSPTDRLFSLAVERLGPLAEDEVFVDEIPHEGAVSHERVLKLPQSSLRPLTYINYA